MERNLDQRYDTRSSASGAGTLTDDVVLDQAPAAADVNLPPQEGAPVAAADPRELGGVASPAVDHQPIEFVREGMKVVDAAGNEIGKVDFVKMGDPQAVTVSPAQIQRTGGLFENVADAVAAPDAADLPETIAGDLLRVGYLRVDAKGWFAKDRFVPADAITDVAGDTVHIALTKDELAEA